MKVKFIKNDKILEITDVVTQADIDILNKVSSAIPIKWIDKKPTQMPPVSYLRVQHPNYYLPAGLWHRLLKERKAGHNVEFLNTFTQDPEVTKQKIDDYIDSLGLIYTLADHQLSAVYTALKFKETTCTIGTSGGKTFIAYCLAHWLLRKTNFSPDHKYLVIVPSQLLCIQGLNDFEEFQSSQDPEDRKLKTHTIFSKAKNKYTFKESNVVFSTYQSLSNFTEIEGWFEPFDVGVYVDEGHKATDSIKHILSHMTRDLVYKNGFSGSFPPDHSVEMLNIETFVGANLYQFKTAKLRDAGFTSDFAIIPVKVYHSADDTRAYFQMLKHEHDIRKVYNLLMDLVNDLQKKKIRIVDRGIEKLSLGGAIKFHKSGKMEYLHADTYEEIKQKLRELYDAGANTDFNRRLAEEEFLFSSANRHKALAQKLVGKLDKNTLVLSRRRNDVRGLYEAGAEYLPNKTCHLIMGGVSNKDKQEAIDTVKNDDDFSSHVIYGNVDMVGTGTSIKNLFYACFCGIGKSPSNAIQTVGRMIRKFHAKNKSFIFDTYDVFECDVEGVPSHWKRTYSENHFKERMKIYDTEDYEVMKTKERTIQT